MQLQVTIGMEINFHPGDQIPVVDAEKRVIGHVVEVRAVYVLDGQEHTQVTVEVEDSEVQRGIALYTETQRPVFGIFFPRTPNDIDHIFKVSHA